MIYSVDRSMKRMKAKKFIRCFAITILLISLCTFGYSCFTDYRVDQIRTEGGVSLELPVDKGIASVTQSGYVVKKNDIGWYKKGSVAKVQAKTKIGYTFDGWYKDNVRLSSTEQYSYIIKEYSVLSAKAQPIEYRIFYDLNGGVSKDNPDSYTIEETVTLKDPQRAGYTFTGWTGSNGTTPQKELKIPAGNTGDKSYTANWKANTYKIRYDSNTGSGYMADSSYTYDTKDRLAPNEYTKSGHTFSGWNTEADGSGTSYKDQDSIVNISDKPGAVVTLYAQWQINSITYELNGGTQDSRNPSTYDVGVGVLTLYSPSKENCKFEGWYTEPFFENKVIGISGDSTGPVTLYAKWTECSGDEVFLKNYYIDNSVNGQAYIYLDISGESQVSRVQLPTWTEFDGQDDIVWYECTKGSYEVNGITYNYKTLVKKDEHKGEYGPYNSHVNYYDLPNTSHSLGKTEQYYLGSDTGYHLEYDSGCLNRTCTQPIKATREYTGTGSVSGMFQTITDKSATYCGSCSYRYPLNVHYIEYYTTCSHLGNCLRGFKLWGYCTHNGGYAGPLTDGQMSGTVSHTYKYCPGHVTPNTYTVKYHPNGGTGNMEDSSYTYDVGKTLSANGFTNGELTFLGWNTESNGSGISYKEGESVKNLTDVNNGVITLYAQWDMGVSSAVYYEEENPAEVEAPAVNEVPMPEEESMYTVRFDGNGNTAGSMEDSQFLLDREFNLEINGYIRDGYEFAGWNTSADGSGIMYEDQASVINMSDEPGAVVVLYAQWTSLDEEVSEENLISGIL